MAYVRVRHNLFLFVCLLYIIPVSEAQQSDSVITDRPSARQLPSAEFIPENDEEEFVLPPIAEPDGSEKVAPLEDKLTIDVNKIQIDGNTVFSEEQLQSIARTFENKSLTVADIEDLRLQLSRYYIDRGYISSGAIIPKQAYKDGVLHIQVIEGVLEDVQVRGTGGLSEGYVAERLQRDPEQPINLQELQDRYQLLLSDPLIERMNGRILPGSEMGRAILDVDVTRALPYHLELFSNNQRPPTIGAEAVGMSGWVRNLTGFGDVLDFTYIHSEGSDRFAGGFSLPITGQGTQVFFRWDEGDAFVLDALAASLDISSKVHSLEGGVSHLFIDTVKQRLNLGMLLAVRENETFSSGSPFPLGPGSPTGRNQVTVFRIFQDYLHRWERHALAVRSTMNFGLDALGSTPEGVVSTQDQDSEFFSWLGQFQYAYRVHDNGTQFIMRGSAQFSDEPLLSLERIAIGGLNTVRGYRENQLVTDQGYNLQIEFHYPLIGGNDPEARHRFTLIPFLDYGEGWNHKTQANADPQSEALFSVGVGFNWELKPLEASLFYGYRLNTPSVRNNGDLQDDGIHFQAKLNFF